LSAVSLFMKRLLLYFALLLCTITSMAQRRNSAYEDYINRYKDIAIEQMMKHHIPASITLAQGLLESGAGKSLLTVSSNNHFGIKCHNEWTGRRFYKDDDIKDDCFRVYDNARESFEDHSKFLLRPRYQSLFSLKITDYKGWARGLKACGYATNPQYADKLIGLIELYGLYEYDYAKKYDKFIATHSGANTSGHYANHRIYYRNKNYYLVANGGETFKSLAEEVGVSYRKLAKYNERDKKDVLSKGDIIYMEKKRSKAEKMYKNQPHVVRANESLYDIAQLYGIRLKYLYKKNGLPLDYVPRPGDRLRVY